MDAPCYFLWKVPGPEPGGDCDDAFAALRSLALTRLGLTS